MLPSTTTEAPILRVVAADRYPPVRTGPIPRAPQVGRSVDFRLQIPETVAHFVASSGFLGVEPVVEGDAAPDVVEDVVSAFVARDADGDAGPFGDVGEGFGDQKALRFKAVIENISTVVEGVGIGEAGSDRGGKYCM